MTRTAASIVLVVALGVASSASAMIAPSLLRDVVHEALPRYRQCAGGVPVATPGTISVSFTVAADGTVTEAEVVHDEIGREDLAECVVHTTLSLRFPALHHGAMVRVHYPFRFE